MPGSVSPPAQLLLFSCVWPLERDAAAYLALPENKVESYIKML